MAAALHTQVAGDIVGKFESKTMTLERDRRRGSALKHVEEDIEASALLGFTLIVLAFLIENDTSL